MRDRHTVRVVPRPQRGEQQHQFEVSQVVTSHGLPPKCSRKPTAESRSEATSLPEVLNLNRGPKRVSLSMRRFTKSASLAQGCWNRGGCHRCGRSEVKKGIELVFHSHDLPLLAWNPNQLTRLHAESTPGRGLDRKPSRPSRARRC
jgi:hypothetical protein